MTGAIIGDIVGSRYEFHNHRSKDFSLFTFSNITAFSSSIAAFWISPASGESCYH